MPHVDATPAGSFCWVDLATTDPEGAKAFYSELFGWSTEDQPAGDAGTYTMCTLGGRNVCGLSAQPKMMKDQGMPPVWTSYVCVQSADETAAKAKSLGGTAITEPFDVMTAGRMALLQDPAGAVFAVWQPKEHGGVGVINQPGALCWNELLTKDTSKASEFYKGLFGWQSMTAGDYTEFKNSGQPAGGMMELTAQMGGAPVHWGVYFAVASVDETTERVKSLGGKVYKEPTNIPNVGRFAVLSDPQGGGFAIIKLGQHH